MAQYNTRVAAGAEEGRCCISAGRAAPLYRFTENSVLYMDWQKGGARAPCAPMLDPPLVPPDYRCRHNRSPRTVGVVIISPPLQ